MAGVSAEDYLYQSIVQPADYVVEGYADVMPPAFGERLQAAQLQDLVAFLRTQTAPYAADVTLVTSFDEDGLCKIKAGISTVFKSHFSF